MDSYKSIQNNLEILQIPGKQVFYSEFYLKLKIQVPGAGFVKDFLKNQDAVLRKYQSFENFVTKRITEQIQWYQKVNTWNVAGSPRWSEKQIQQLKKVDTDFLNAIVLLVQTDCVKKTRMDGYNHDINFYFTTLAELENFLSKLPIQYQDKIVFLENSLNSKVRPNQKLVKKRTTPRYKVHLRDQGKVTDAHRQLLKYLESLGETVVLPSKICREFAADSPHNYYYNVYFYTDNLEILSFMELIVPGIVGRTLEIIETPDG